MASQNYNHRIGQNKRRREEAEAKIAAEAAERDVTVLGVAKSYTDEQVGQERRDRQVLASRVSELEKARDRA